MMPDKMSYQHQFGDPIPIVMATPSENDDTAIQSSSTEVQALSAVSLLVHEAQVVTIDEQDQENEVTPLVMHSNSHQQPRHRSEGVSYVISTPSGIPEQPPSSSSFLDESDDDAFSSLIKQNDSTFRFRDWPFGVLFWIHIAIMLWVGITYSSAGYKRVAQDWNWTQVEQQIAESDDVSLEDLQQFETFMEDAYEWVQGYIDRIIWYSKVPAAVASMIFVDITLAWVLKPCTKAMVTLTLVCSITVVVLGALVSLLVQPSIFCFLLTSLIVGAVSFFVCQVWSLIPFVSANIKTGLIGLNENIGIYLWAMFFSYICMAWVVFWFYTLFGLSFLIHIRCEDRLYPEEQSHLVNDCDDDCDLGVGIFLLLGLSLYWTTNVIINYLRCTVAGVTATWLYAKDDARCCCSFAIWGSLMRGATYSFGSICFGSLVQGFIGFLRCIISSAKRNRDDTTTGNDNGCCGGLCHCIVDCVANLGGDVLDYFSQWNYIYIALYGFSYIESGKAVMRLFRFKGWQLNSRGSMSIISERLTSYVLGWISISMGMLTGVFVLVAERIVTWRHPESEHESYVYGPLPHWRVVAFIIGFIIGLVISSVLMHVVKGAVNTLIVCWADNPGQIESEHPDMSRMVLEAWLKSFPHLASFDQVNGAPPRAFSTESIV